MVKLNIPLPDHFLDEEERSGFLVTRQQKEIWAIEIDLLMKLDQVCRKHGLKYCIGAGTLLGAVRHQGFIPWDDDIDIYMVRSDYDKLMELADEFEPPYFLQNNQTEKNKILWHARLRNNQTTGVPSYEYYYDICKGLFVDIFPLDGIANDPRADALHTKENSRLKRRCKLYNMSINHKHYKKASKKIIKIFAKAIAPICLRNRDKLQKAYDDNLKKYSVDGSRLWGHRTIFFDCPKSRRPLEDYTDLIRMPFEFIEVPAPRNYDPMLRQQYGDYMKIPENKKGNLHGTLVVSTDYAFDDPRRTEKQ